MTKPSSSPRVTRIVSGGQTGVDRGALDAAIALGMDHGGWCPHGRRAEDGVIPSQYRLQESTSRAYHVRTELNVQHSDGTLILFRGELSRGTALTQEFAQKHRQPCLLINLGQEPSVAAARDWLIKHRIAVLNVAGPRESSAPDICREAHAFLTRLFSANTPSPRGSSLSSPNKICHNQTARSDRPSTQHSQEPVMQSPAKTVAAYLASLPADRRVAMEAVRKVILQNLDPDIEEGMMYGTIGYFIPHRVFPAGYHCDPKQPLCYAGLGSQKNYMSLYLMACYGHEQQEAWLREQWAKTGKKLDKGKVCIRFKTLADLPLALIGEAIRRVSAKAYIAHYEAMLQSRNKGSTKKTSGNSSAAKAAKVSSAAKSKSPTGTVSKKSAPPAPKKSRSAK